MNIDNEERCPVFDKFSSEELDHETDYKDEFEPTAFTSRREDERHWSDKEHQWQKTFYPKWAEHVNTCTHPFCMGLKSSGFVERTLR